MARGVVPVAEFFGTPHKMSALLRLTVALLTSATAAFSASTAVVETAGAGASDDSKGSQSTAVVAVGHSGGFSRWVWKLKEMSSGFDSVVCLNLV